MLNKFKVRPHILKGWGLKAGNNNVLKGWGLKTNSGYVMKGWGLKIVK